MSRRHRRKGKRPPPDAPATIPLPAATAPPTPVPAEDDDQVVDVPADDETPPSWELRLEQRAFDEGWATPPEVRHLVVTRALDLIDDQTARGRRFDVDAKIRIAAMKVVLAAADHNLKAQKLELETRKLELDRARQEAPPATTPESVDAETVRIAAIRARRSALSLDAEPQPTEPDAQSTTE
jgi:hypothetical protein